MPQGLIPNFHVICPNFKTSVFSVQMNTNKSSQTELRNFDFSAEKNKVTISKLLE